MCSTGMGGVYNSWGEFLLVILLIFLTLALPASLDRSLVPINNRTNIAHIACTTMWVRLNPVLHPARKIGFLLFRDGVYQLCRLLSKCLKLRFGDLNVA